jgi:hypothetical protein
MAVCRFVSLLDGLNEGWLDDPVFRPIVEGPGEWAAPQS